MRSRRALALISASPFAAVVLWQLIFFLSFDDEDLWLGSVPTTSGEPVAVALPGMLIVGISTGVVTRVLKRRRSLTTAPRPWLFGLVAATLPLGASWAIGAGCPGGDPYAIPEDPTTTFPAMVVPALIIFAVAATMMIRRERGRLLPVGLLVAVVVGVATSFVVSGGPQVCDWNI